MRRRELGLRLALGATPARLVWLVIVQGVAPVVLGVSVGTCALLALRQVVAATIARSLPSFDPFVLGATSIGLMAVALMGSYIPARAAAWSDPNMLLKDAPPS
jgi:ABC-type antimicrobial peptide transport system permease subunit